MKLRSLLFISAGIIAILAVVWFVQPRDVSNVSAAYVPRSDMNSPAGISGAMEYYNMIRANVYTGEVEPEDILAVRAAVRDLQADKSKNADVIWSSMGPNNVGGRLRAIISFPDEPNTLIAGGVSGGLFKSTNGGLAWHRIPNFQDALAVSSIAILGNGAIYVGTGHSREGISGGGGSGFIGGGLYVSEDDGETWSLVSDFEPNAFSTGSDWATIDKIKADPVDPDKLWISNNFGFFPYIHGSDELEPLPTGLYNDRGSHFDISTDGEYILLHLGSRIHLSRDGGETFTELGGSVGFASGNVGATDLVISPLDKNFMAASISTPPGFQSPYGFLRGVYVSIDGGLNWHVVAPASNVGGNISQFAPFYNGQSAQGWYDNMLTVVPHEDGTKELILGGIRMWRWVLAGTPGISAWEAVNLNFASSPGQAPSPYYVHSDIHTAHWDANGTLYVGTDGGVFKSTDKGVTWSDMNRDFLTTQYYAIAFDPEGRVMGGLQDNGTLYLKLDGSDPKLAISVSGGDGFSSEISQYFPNYLFATLYYGTTRRSTDFGANMTPGSFGDLDMKLTTVNKNDFYTDIALYENANNEFSEIDIEYIVTIDNPYLENYDTPVVTAEGDTAIASIPAGTTILVDNDNNDFQTPVTLEEDLLFYSHYVRNIGGEDFAFQFVGDTLLVRETAQFQLAVAVSRGVFVTREPMKTNGTPRFIKIDNGEPNSNPTSLEWSPDGDVLYVGYANGRILRFKNFNSAWEYDEYDMTKPAYVIQKHVIHQGTGPILDIEVDYSQGRGGIDTPASPKVVIATGGYGGNAKVLVSQDAVTPSGSGTFQNIWNVAPELQGMPVYSVVMDVADTDIIMAGTEYGVWYTDNGGDTWTEANNGEMPRVPVFDLRQQKFGLDIAENSGVVYAGTHGMGVFRTDYLGTVTGLDDLADMNKPMLSGLKVYPNPVAGDLARVEFNLAQNSEVSHKIYTLTGQLVASEGKRHFDAGRKQTLNLDISSLPAGAYIVIVEAGDATQTGKFIKSL